MPNTAALALPLQSQLAPALHATAAALAAALDRRADAAEVAALPNLGLLLQALAGYTLVGGGSGDYGQETIQWKTRSMIAAGRSCAAPTASAGASTTLIFLRMSVRRDRAAAPRSCYNMPQP